LIVCVCDLFTIISLFYAKININYETESREIELDYLQGYCFYYNLYMKLTSILTCLLPRRTRI